MDSSSPEAWRSPAQTGLLQLVSMLGNELDDFDDELEIMETEDDDEGWEDVDETESEGHEQEHTAARAHESA